MRANQLGWTWALWAKWVHMVIASHYRTHFTHQDFSSYLFCTCIIGLCGFSILFFGFALFKNIFLELRDAFSDYVYFS